MSEAYADDVDTSAGELQRRALAGSFWMLLSAAASLPLGLVANAVVARQLGPVEYGELAFLLLVHTVAFQLSELGFVVAQTQWGVEATVRGDRAAARRLLSQGLGFRLLIQLPVVASVGLVVLRHHGIAAQGGWVIVSALYMPLVSVSMALLFENRTATVARINILVNMAVQVGIVVAAVMTGAPVVVLFTRVAVGLLLHAVAVALVGRRERAAALRPRSPLRMPTGYWRFAAPAAFAAGLSLLVHSRSEIVVLRWYGEVSAAGVFAVAFGLSQQLTAPVDALLAPLLPAVSGLVSAHPGHAARGTLRAIRYFALLTGAMLATLPAVAFAVPVVFGDAFASAGPLLIPLGVASALQTLSSPLTLLAYAQRRGSTLALVNGAALVVDLVAAFALIPVAGAWGAVVANAAAQLTATAMLVRAGIRAESLNLRDVARQSRAWVVALVTLPLALVAGAAASGWAGPVAAVIAAAAVGLGSFTLAVRAIHGGLDVDDATAILNAVPERVRGVVGVALQGVGAGR